MTVGSKAVREQILPALARVRSILDEVSVEAQRTATEHDLLAAWHAKRGDANAARLERQAAAVHQLRLADLDAAFDALDRAAFAALDLDPQASPPVQRLEPAGPIDEVSVVAGVDGASNDQPHPA
jgi:uncharacterized membrane protein YqiK